MKNFLIITLLSVLGFVTIKFPKKSEKQSYETNTIVKNVSYSGNVDFRHAAKIGTKAVVHVTAKKKRSKNTYILTNFMDCTTIISYLISKVHRVLE